jgi:energy-coupling factor transport system ATP-binding protein
VNIAVEASVRFFQYPRATRPAIHDVELKVRRGEFVVITGPAGAGKTTLCYCLAGIIPHFVNGLFEGHAAVNGRSLADLRLTDIAGLVGFVLQRPENQLFNPTVEEDVAFGPENLCLEPHHILDRLRSSLDFTGMRAYTKRTCSSLSGGETQRIVLSSILAMGPELLILDQPAAELDPLGRKQIYENIYRLNREAGKTIILIEDRLSDILSYASRLILMHEGKMVKDASPVKFFADKSVFSLGIRVPNSIKPRLPSEFRFEVAPGDAFSTRPPQKTMNGNGMAPDESVKSLARSSSTTIHDGTRPNNELAIPIVQIQELSFRYPDSRRWALENVSLCFRRSELTAIIGQNGAGKTTLAKHLIGLLRATNGKVLINGRDIARASTAQLSDTVGYLFQDPDLQIFCNSVFDEVAFGLKARRFPRDRISHLVDESTL